MRRSNPMGTKSIHRIKAILVAVAILAVMPVPAAPTDALDRWNQEDCVNFDPATIRLRQVNGRWKLAEGSRWLFDFGSNQTAAKKALQVIVRYRMNRTCFIGRPEPSFTYLLAKGGIPAGPMAGEDCVAFDPQRVRVSKIQNRWKIVQGRRWLFDFGKKETEARRALATIKRYGFARSCFVGRPQADFSYLRR